MRRYFNEYKFFDWLRERFGIEKPMALELGMWQKWEDKLKAEKPVGYFLTETFPDFLDSVENFFFTPFRNIRYYIRNRWHRKTHVLPTGLKVGDYYDLDTRIVHGLMTALVDFVEVEKAWMQKITSEEEVVLVRGRNAQAGMAYLSWEATLDNPELPETERSPTQAETAREIVKIYWWWTAHRPARPDPWDMFLKVSDDIYDPLSWDNVPEDVREQRRAHYKAINEKEEEYHQEDTEMLIRLIAIRRSLWT